MSLIGAFEPLKQGSLPLTRDSGGNSPVSSALGRNATPKRIKLIMKINVSLASKTFPAKPLMMPESIELLIKSFFQASEEFSLRLVVSDVYHLTILIRHRLVSNRLINGRHSTASLLTCSSSETTSHGLAASLPPLHHFPY